MAYVNLGQVIYPVGAIFVSASPISPSSMFGGTWSQITGDACLMAGTTTGNVGSKTISEAQMPRHSHVLSQGGAEKPTDTGHRNVGKAWYQTLGEGSFTTLDGDYLYTGAGQKCQWITQNAGTRLTGGGGRLLALLLQMLYVETHCLAVRSELASQAKEKNSLIAVMLYA